MGDDKRSVYNRSGLGHRIGYGKRPALLVVDMQIGFTAPEKSPLAGNLDSQVAAINKLITTARKKDVPNASAFLGTPLSATLVTRGVDTLIVTGCTTSGCVRASVVDALSHGFRPIIPHEAVGDRAEEPHEANLFDMDSKYGDVVSLADALAYLEELKS